ncbi:MAG: hypothetical protein H7228_14985, partial [Polaromonas sp.]|nr:hypothetical protein [Polaromonas sp.]
MKKSFNQVAKPMKLVVAMALSAGMLSACGGGDTSSAVAVVPPVVPPVVVPPVVLPPVTNVLPTGLTQLSVTVYASTVRGTGDTAATQDLFTAGLGRTGIAGAAPAYA